MAGVSCLNLTADNQVNIVAATNTGVNTNSTSGSSASIGVGFNLGSNTGFTLNASASKNQGQGNGKDTSYSNSAVTAGGTATVKSGGDTNLVGGTITANKVVTDIGGDLNIASPQATSTYTESSSSSGFGVKLCLPPLCAGSSTFTVSAGQNNIDSNFQSTGEASGIRAGDGGFQVKVDGKTTLTGGQITSTQVAVDKNLNTYSAAGGTTTTDLANSANPDISRNLVRPRPLSSIGACRGANRSLTVPQKGLHNDGVARGRNSPYPGLGCGPFLRQRAGQALDSSSG